MVIAKSSWCSIGDASCSMVCKGPPTKRMEASGGLKLSQCGCSCTPMPKHHETVQLSYKTMLGRSFFVHEKHEPTVSKFYQVLGGPDFVDEVVPPAPLLVDSLPHVLTPAAPT